MPDRLFKFYQRHKILNINVNVVLSGFLAIAVAKYPVAVVTGWMDEGYAFWKTVAAAIIDGIADVIIYYVLHYLANHWRPFRPKNELDQPDEPGLFFRNATLVQFERLALTPVYYLIAMGLMYGLIKARAMPDSWAFVTGFGVAIVVTRIIHTVWMLRQGVHKRPKTAPAPEADRDAA